MSCAINIIGRCRINSSKFGIFVAHAETFTHRITTNIAVALMVGASGFDRAAFGDSVELRARHQQKCGPSGANSSQFMKWRRRNRDGETRPSDVIGDVVKIARDQGGQQ